jgi:hypothetical protein
LFGLGVLLVPLVAGLDQPAISLASIVIFLIAFMFALEQAMMDGNYLVLKQLDHERALRAASQLGRFRSRKGAITETD